MRKLLKQIIAGILSIFFASRFVPNVILSTIPEKSFYFGIKFSNDWQILILVGTALGLIIFCVKPILDLITFPLKILTLGFFSLILYMGIIWFLDVVFAELKINGISALFGTTVITWLFFSLFNLK